MTKHKFGKNRKEMIVTKDQADTLKRITRASCGGDDFSVKSGVLTKGAVQVATNGFMVLAIKSDDNLPDEVQGVNAIETEGRICAYEKREGIRPFPDVFKIIPQGEPVFEIKANARLLTLLLDSMIDGTSVTMRFYGDKLPFELISRIDGESNVYAILMPMHVDGIDVGKRPLWLDEIKPQAEAAS